jgi:hypothetical protein
MERNKKVRTMKNKPAIYFDDGYVATPLGKFVEDLGHGIYFTMAQEAAVHGVTPDNFEDTPEYLAAEFAGRMDMAGVEIIDAPKKKR